MVPPLTPSPPTHHTHRFFSLLIPADSEALLELRLLWRLEAFWYGGCQSVDIFLLLPPQAGAFDSLFGLGSWSPRISPLLRHPPPSYPAKFHVCPHPQGTLSKFTLGQLGLSRGPINLLRVGVGWGGPGGWVMGKRMRAITWGRQGVLGKGFQDSPFPHFNFSRIGSDP